MNNERENGINMSAFERDLKAQDFPGLGKNLGDNGFYTYVEGNRVGDICQSLSDCMTYLTANYQKQPSLIMPVVRQGDGSIGKPPQKKSRPLIPGR
jgi:hypothetical protein